MEDTDKRCLLEEDLSSRVQSLIAGLYRMTQQVQAVWEIRIISSFLNYKLCLWWHWFLPQNTSILCVELVS